MRMKKKTRIGLNIGTSSILLVFVLLCMVTFAALSFVSANADYKLSLSLSSRTTAYYNASNTAQTQLDSLHRALSDIDGRSQDSKDYCTEAARVLASPDILGQSAQAPQNYSYAPGANQTDCGTLTWQLPFTDTQALEVRLKLLNPYEDAGLFEVTGWQVVTTAEWTDDAPLNLFDGS